MTDTRNCYKCAHYSGEGCGSWECEFIDRKEAIRAWKKLKSEEAETKPIPHDDYVESGNDYIEPQTEREGDR